MTTDSITLLGLDLGTTHCKAGLYALDGRALYIASRDNPAQRSPQGYSTYNPETLWNSVGTLLSEVEAWRESQGGRWYPTAAIGVAGMAETGLVLDRELCAPRTPFIPWFDPVATPQAEELRRRFDVRQRFYRTGLRPAYKHSLPKIVWLKEQQGVSLDNAVWLGAAEYIVYRLTGAFATDTSLAGRTYAFCIDDKTWDGDTLDQLDIPVSLFPSVLPSGWPAGQAKPGLAAFGLQAGTPVAVAGHDHVCAAFAAQALAGMHEAPVFDSIGTAESLTGAFPERPLEEADFQAGFAFGLYGAPGHLYWMGGLSASGGSIEWLRKILGDPPLSYAELDAISATRSEKPTGILYFPYLSGSGSPHSDSLVRGAFIGLTAAHGRADLYNAVLEGAAFEIEFMRRAAESVTGGPVRCILAAGGGTRNRRWMQIKADVFGCPLDVLGQKESTLLGAALLAGIGSGVYADVQAVAVHLGGCGLERFEPDPGRHAAYKVLFEGGYLPLQEGLRAFGSSRQYEV
jgi:sugar (pentulose or hexulose) kinase